MVANILTADPLPTPDSGGGVKGKNSTFSEHGHVAYQIKVNHECNNMVAHILPSRPLGSNFNISEDGHVAYQIKGNNECSNMVANILPADPTSIPLPTLGVGSID